MEQIGDLPIPSPENPDTTGSAATFDIDWIRIARTAIVSGACVLATGLIAVTSAATLRIGPFNTAASSSPPSPFLHPDAGVRPNVARVSGGMAGISPMLIAQDPGDDAWQRLLAGGPTAQNDLPISVTSLKAPITLGAVPKITYNVVEMPLGWMKLSAIRAMAALAPVIAFSAAPQSSLFTKNADPHPAADTTSTQQTASTADGSTATATGSSQPAQAVAQKSQPDPTPAAAISAPTAPVQTAQATLPPIILPPPPPPQTDDTPPPSDGATDPSTPSTPAASVPEPASWISFIVGFGLIGLGRRAARNRTTPTA